MSFLLAGIGRSDITPAPGTPQGGWGAQTHQRGVGVDMALYATALVLSDQVLSVAIVDADAIGFDSEWTNKILDAIVDLTHLPREQVRFSCTHTHSGPNTFRLATITEGLEMARGYLEELPYRIAGAVWQAQKNLQPVRLAAGLGSCDINVNRRLKLEDGQVIVGNNWDGSVDHSVRVVRFDDLHQKPVATLLHYACHPTIMGWACEVHTPDYPGVARQVVERELGGTCLFLQGATGNVGPRQGFTGDVRVYRRLGTLLGLEAAKVATSLDTVPRRQRLTGVMQSGAPIGIYEQEPVHSEPPVLRVISRDLKLPLTQFRPVAELETAAALARQEFEALMKTGTESEIRAARSRATQAGMRAENARQYEGRTHLDWQLQGIRIGPVALLSIPGEPFTEINRSIVSQSPFEHTLFSGYSNGGFGYMPVRSAFPEGGYEVEISLFSPDAAEIVELEGVRMLRELAGN